MVKILIVEDDNNLREIYGARLEAEGYQIVGASDGEEALAIAIRERPDLIISDIMMPKISGFDMLDILRSTPETKDVKVIVMTALSQDEDRRRGEQLGADKYVVKSQVTLDDVVSMVEEIIATIPSRPETQPPISPDQPSPEQPPQTTYTEPQAAALAPNPSNENLAKEVENFVATSPLMNGVPPTDMSGQIVDPASNPAQPTAPAPQPPASTDMTTNNATPS